MSNTLGKQVPRALWGCWISSAHPQHSHRMCPCSAFTSGRGMTQRSCTLLRLFYCKMRSRTFWSQADYEVASQLLLFKGCGLWHILYLFWESSNSSEEPLKVANEFAVTSQTCPATNIHFLLSASTKFTTNTFSAFSCSKLNNMYSFSGSSGSRLI